MCTVCKYCVERWHNGVRLGGVVGEKYKTKYGGYQSDHFFLQFGSVLFAGRRGAIWKPAIIMQWTENNLLYVALSIILPGCLIWKWCSKVHCTSVTRVFTVHFCLVIFHHPGTMKSFYFLGFPTRRLFETIAKRRMSKFLNFDHSRSLTVSSTVFLKPESK